MQLHIAQQLNYNNRVTGPGGMERGDITDTLVTGTEPQYEWTEPHRDFLTPYADIDVTCDTEAEYEARLKTVLPDAIATLVKHVPDISKGELRISSYNGVERSKAMKKGEVVPVAKYGKWLISYHIVLYTYHATRAECKEWAKALKADNPVFDTAVYNKNQLFRIGGHHKYPKKHRDEGCRTPLLLYRRWMPVTPFNKVGRCEWVPVEKAAKVVQDEEVMDFRYQHLVTYIPDRDYTRQLPLPKPGPMPALVVPPTPTPSSPGTAVATTPSPPPSPPPSPDATTTATTTATIDDGLMALLEKLPDECLHERGKWWYITKLVKCIATTTGDAVNTKHTWDVWSKRSGHYDGGGNEQQ